MREKYAVFFQASDKASHFQETGCYTIVISGMERKKSRDNSNDIKEYHTSAKAYNGVDCVL